MYTKISGIIRFFLLLGVLSYLSIPIVGFFAGRPQPPILQGSYTIYEKPSFSWKNWTEGVFQLQFDQYYNQQFRYQAFFVQLNNQFFFSCFQESKANGTVVGKDDYLYESKYIKSYLGNDFIGKAQLNKTVEKIKALQDYLKQNNTDLILVLAPNKARFYSEYIPTPFDSEVPRESNLVYLRENLVYSGIHYIDFDRWLISLKTKNETLFTKYGTHWSECSAVLATDSLFRYVTQLKQRPPFSIVIDSLEQTNQARGTDRDIGDGLNLLWELPQTNYWYPHYHLKGDSSLKDLSVLSVGDSFYWSIFYLMDKEALVKKNDFWYYNKEVYPESFTKKTPVITKHVASALKRYDVVILIVSEPQLHNILFDLDKAMKW